MRAAIFVGPTLTADEVCNILDAEILPPVGQGDVYRVARGRPRAIGIIDGYFEGVPSVWHKEILWALEQGIPVYGSASMGALRAAELDGYGMIGVGRIFEAYRSGVIRDDDEVAVLHGPGELGYAPLSEPMVSIRATAEQARTEGIITPKAAEALVAAAKALNYRDRNWPGILDRVNGALVTGFAEWLPHGRKDAKAEDAREMLNAMALHMTEDHAPPKSKPKLERTLVWQSLTRRIDAELSEPDTPTERLLDELRLDPFRFALVRDRAMLRMLAQEPVGAKPSIDRRWLVDVMSQHRTRLGLSHKAHMLGWLNENDLDEAGYEAMLTETVLVRALTDADPMRLERYILNELRWSGEYSELKERARAKAQIVQPSGSFTSPDRTRLMIWYFETLLDQTVPENLDTYIKTIGVADRAAFHDIVEREFQYRARCNDRAEGGEQTRD